VILQGGKKVHPEGKAGEKKGPGQKKEGRKRTLYLFSGKSFVLRGTVKGREGGLKRRRLCIKMNEGGRGLLIEGWG